MNQLISTFVLLSFLATSSAIQTVSSAAADVKGAADVKSSSAAAAAQAPYSFPVLTLDDVHLAINSKTPKGFDKALNLLELFFEKAPRHIHRHAAIRQLMEVADNMSDVQQIRVAKLNSLLPTRPIVQQFPKVPADSWFAKIAREEKINFELTSKIHKFVLEEAQHERTPWFKVPACPEDVKAASAQVHAALNADQKNGPFPRDLAAMIGEYAAGGWCPDIDSLLLKVAQSEHAPLMERQLKSAETIVRDALRVDNARFNAYRELTKKVGVKYSLSREERQRWESSGYTFRPMITKRARMVCDECSEITVTAGVPPAPVKVPVTEISNFFFVNGDYDFTKGLTYMEPADYHDYSKPHPPAVAALKARSILDPSVPTCENMPDPNTPEFTRYLLRRLSLRARQASKLPDDTPLRQAAHLWLNFFSNYDQLMGWALAARYMDDPDNWKPDSETAWSNTPLTYKELQQFMLQQ